MTEFTKDFLPEWCANCNQQCFYFVDAINSSHLILHKKCGHEALNTWCPQCEMGFALPNKSGDRPPTWDCPNCNSTYPLDDLMFDKPIYLYTADELPEDTRLRVMSPKKGVNPVIITGITIMMLIIVAYLLLK